MLIIPFYSATSTAVKIRVLTVSRHIRSSSCWRADTCLPIQGPAAGCAAAFYYSDETQVQVACQAENVRFMALLTSFLTY